MISQTTGLLVGGMIVALRVTRGEASPSEFVVFITYLAQVGHFRLSSPLVLRLQFHTAVWSPQPAGLYLSVPEHDFGRHGETNETP